MAGYQPVHITGNTTGLVQQRQNFLIPNDAYPSLVNAYIWREQIRRKQAFELLGRLKRTLEAVSIGNTGASPWAFNVFTLAAITEPNAAVNFVEITFGGITFTDNGDGTLTGSVAGNSGTINYATGDIVLTHTAGAGVAATADISYFPALPVMGLRSRELTAINDEDMIAFDTRYAYRVFSTGFEEWLPGTTWTGTDADFFWSTNWWVGEGELKIFWVSNFVDPIRYTNGVAGTNWIDFTPVINAAGDVLNRALCLLPFRGRLVLFNTVENNAEYPNRIRWSAIGTPFTTAAPPVVVTGINAQAWRDDIRGQGGFLDIPTNEDIITVGFVRDNLVIYCERSTWQLRYTSRSIAPFQIDRVNSELGVESTFSGVQFDTSLVGIGDKGIVECDSYKSSRIDIKIPDLVQTQINNTNQGPARVHGIRNFEKRLAYWTYPNAGTSRRYPDRRLVYNYENDSWAIFTDSLTCFGTYQDRTSRTWRNSPFPWKVANFPWLDRPALFPSVMGGNQQGFVLFLDEATTNEESLFISDITGFGGVTDDATLVESISHNLLTNNVIQILGIPAGSPFENLNGGIFGIVVKDEDTFTIWKYDPATEQFSDPQIDDPGVYIGKGVIRVRDNFQILSKKFNYLDQGQKIQIGYVDILASSTPSGEITLNVYENYNDNVATNQAPQNASRDTFFNNKVPTTVDEGVDGGEKNWKRVMCPSSSNFLTLEWTLSNEQMAGAPQENNVQIDAQIIWQRAAGRMQFNP
jgi:hypothetical protein